MIKYFHDRGIKSLSFKRLNHHLQKLNQPQLTYDLLSLMYDQDERLQSLITSMTPDAIDLGKKTDDTTLSQKIKSQAKL